MSNLIADFRKPLAAARAQSGMLQADRMRFVAGLAITGAGAAAFLADLLARMA